MKNAKSVFADFLFYIIGSFLFSVGIYSFAEGADIAPGGISGIAIMVKYLCGFPIGTLTLILNIPLLFIASKKISGAFVLKTLCTLIINSIILDYIVSVYFPQYTNERLLSCIFSGVFTGLGLALILKRGASTGGTDIICLLIEKKHPHIQIGTAIMAVDAVIVIISAFVFKNIESALFSAVAIFVQIKVIDAVIYGMDKCSQIIIISKRNDAIAKKIIISLHRGATFLNASGAYLKNSFPVLLCVVRKQEFAKLKEIVLSEDKNAFMIISETTQIVGEGFEYRH